MKTMIKSLLSIILCLAMILPLASCGHHNIEIDKESAGQYWEDIPDNGKSSADKSIWDDTSEPNINVTVIGGEIELPGKEQYMETVASQNADIYSMVYTAVQADLSTAGFEVSSGLALSENQNGYSALGLYYYDDEFNIFDSNDIKSCGFVEIVNSDNDNYLDAFRDEDLIIVLDVETISEVPQNYESEISYVYSYNYENIQSDHFIYKGKYITYYQESEMRVKYMVQENEKANYDLSLGSLFDYDNHKYIYDETIFGEYRTHSGVELFGEEDYARLESDLQVLSDEQLRAGYVVSEFNVVYISPESISTYLLSDEEDTFFGYSVTELTECLGLGTALTYSAEKGFQSAQIIQPTDDSYNWKSFLIKMGIGTGIILVGAILTPITGGASFGCALLTITKVAVTFALTSAISTVAITTAVGMIQGKSVNDAIKAASYAGLDSFATGFMIGAVIGSVGVVSGLIKPTACFVAGTPVAVCSESGIINYIPIEEISIGDMVYSFNEETGAISCNCVTAIQSKTSSELVELHINGETIFTTPNHPFYNLDYRAWKKAGFLKAGDHLFSVSGEELVVDHIKIIHNANTQVYNFTVAEDHTYFVGNGGIGVHNACDAALRKAAEPAQKEAVKKEILSIRNGTSKNTYPRDFIRKIADPKLTDAQAVKKFSGEFAAHHIIPIERISSCGLDPSLATNPKNLLVVLKSEHSVSGSTTAIHQLFGGVGRSKINMGAEYFQYLVKIKPSYAKNIFEMAKIAGVAL